MEWTLTNLLIQTIAGFFGANGAATAAHEHKFGFFGHSLVGSIAGVLSGYFLQLPALTVVTGSGSIAPPTPVEIFILQGLTGAMSGAVAMFAVGFVVQHRSENR